MKKVLAILLLGSLAASDRAAAMDSEERLLFANGLYRRGLHELAIPEFEALLADPAATNMQDIAWFRIGECQRQLGLTNEAAIAYDRVVADHPASLFAHRAGFRRAELDWQAGRLKDAATRFEAVLARDPPEDIAAAALYHLGLCQLGLDRTATAEKSLRRLVRTYPASPYTDYGRVALADLVLAKDPTSEEAEAWLTDAAEEPETPALGAEALAKSALLSYRAQRHAEAAGRFGSLSERFPESPWIARTRLEAAWAYLLSDQPEAARVLAADGLAEASAEQQPAWWYLDANIARRTGDPVAALAAYDRLLAAAPAHELASAAAFEACTLAWQRDQHARVLELAPRARGPEERALPLRWMEAGAHRALGQTDEARAAYQDIIATFPASDRAPSAAYQLALMLEEDGDPEAAANAFTAVATNYPAHPLAADARMAAGTMWQQAGRMKDAATAFRTLIDEHPGYPALDEAHLGRARAELALDRTKPAAQALDAVIATSTNRRYLAEAHYLRGTLHEQADDPAAAETAYLAALATDPPASLTRQIQFRRVAVLQRQQRDPEAAALMNQLIRDGAGNQLPPALLEWLARWNLEQRADAEAETAALLLARHGNTPGWNLLGHYIAGVAARRQDKTDAAVDAFTQADASPLNAREAVDASFQLGELALAARQPDQAITHFRRAAERATADTMMDLRARSYLHLGLAHEALEDWAEAARYYLSVGVLFDDPTVTPESLYRAAGALQARQLDSQRDRVLDELRQRYPASDWTTRANERWPPPR